MLQLIKKTIFNKYIWLLFIPLLIGWSMLGSRLQTRTDFAMYGQMDTVKRIWGGNLTQPMPSIRYKVFGSDVSSLSTMQPYASNIHVSIAVDYRKKGLVYYTGYNADFVGNYTIKNTESDKIYLSFIFPYPMKEGEGMLRDVKLLVNHQEDRENTEYQKNLILWTGMAEANSSLEMTVQYKGRGLNHFIYGFEPGRQINHFRMTVDIKGASDIDYPTSTMSPTAIEKTANGKKLVWNLDSVLTQLNIGVLLPDQINIARQISIMTDRAPFFFVLFLITGITLFTLTACKVDFLRIAIISVAYFLYYPLFAYLSVYLHVILAFCIAFGVIGTLIFNYIKTTYSLLHAVWVFIAYTFFLGITSIAELLPTYTGLILVIEGVIILAVTMHVLPRFKDFRISDLVAEIYPQPNSTSTANTPSPETHKQNHQNTSSSESIKNKNSSDNSNEDHGEQQDVK